MTKNFLKNVLLNNLSQGLQFGSRWILTITLLKVLSIEMFAIFSFVFSISNFLVSVLPFGSPIYLINKANDSEKGMKELRDSLQIVISIFFGIIFFYGVFYLFNADLENGALIPIGIFLSLVLSLNTVIYSFLKGLGNFTFELKIYSMFSILIFSLAAYLYFIGSLSVLTLLLLLILINGAMLFFAFRFSEALKNNNVLNFNIFDFKSLKIACTNRLYFGLQEVVTASYVQGGALILFYVISKSVYGEYRALLILTAPFSLVNLAVAQVLLSQLKSVSTDNIASAFRKLHFPFMALLAGLLFVIYLLGKPIVKMITGLEYTATIQKSFICVLTIIFVSFVYAGYEMLLVVINKQKHRFWIMLLGAITNVVAIFLLLPKYGLLGAIMTNLLSNVVVFVGMVLITELSIHRNMKN